MFKNLMDFIYKQYFIDLRQLTSLIVKCQFVFSHYLDVFISSFLMNLILFYFDISGESGL